MLSPVLKEIAAAGAILAAVWFLRPARRVVLTVIAKEIITTRRAKADRSPTSAQRGL